MILLRKATESDMALILAWRNNPLIYQGYYTQTEPIEWEGHCEWWGRRNSDWREFMVLLKQGDSIREIGAVTFGQLDHWSPEIGYCIGEVSLWGKGYGKEAVNLACEWLKERGYKHTHTTVPKGNERSIRLLKSLKFKYLGEARKGEIWMQKKL